MQLSNGYYIKTEITKMQRELFSRFCKKTDQKLPMIEFKDITHVYGAYPIGLNSSMGTKICAFSGYFDPI